MTAPELFVTLKFADAPAGIEFLVGLGFTEVARYADDADPSVVHHAELHWRGNGGLMCGSAGVGSTGLDITVGRGSFYAVASDDADVDRIHAAALAAGGTSVRDPNSPDYGGRECTVADPEGNRFSFGSYAGASL